MAKVKWVYPIEELHGKLQGKFGGAQRKLANAKGERDPYTFHIGQRTTTPSDDELAARSKFSAIAKLVGQRRKNVSQRTTDAAAFKAQTACPTMTSYLWSICKATYEASLEED